MFWKNTSRAGSVAAALLVLMGCMVAFGAGAEAPAALPGVYDYVPEQSSDVARAIDQAIEKMNFIKRPIARGRLTKTNTPYQRIRIELTATEAAITYDAREPVRMPLTGQPVKWKRDDGEVFDVAATLDGGKLRQTYQAADGARVNSFHAAASGLLHLEVEVSSPQLPQPVKYVLVYRRTS